MLDTKIPLIAEFLKDHQQFSRLLYEISKLLGANEVEQARQRAIELNAIAGSHIAYEEAELYPRLAALGGESAAEEMLVDQHHDALDSLRGLLENLTPTDELLESIKAGFQAALSHAEHCGTLIGLLTKLDEKEQADSLKVLLGLRSWEKLDGLVMCRLYGFISNEPTKVDCSLVFAQNALMQQSRVDHVGRDHTDGWGIVAYQDGQPEVYKKTTAAYDDGLFSTTAERIYSTAIVAHVRRATVGKITIDNTHPFVFGRWTFAHNGTVTGFDKIRNQLEHETHPELQSQRKGDTDSEQFFLWLLSRMKEHGLDNDLLEAEPADDVTKLIRDYVGQLATLCEIAAPDKTPRLNFVLTDGSTILACRWDNSLSMIRREGLYECEICGIPHIHHHETVNHRAIAIASEPITHEKWDEVPNHSIIVANLAKTPGSRG